MIVIMFLMAMVMEIIDSSLGMMYGTLLSPMFIIMGFSPLVVVPAILISQAIGSISGTIFHHKKKNADFWGLTKHTKIVLAVVAPGIAAVTLGAFIALSIPALWVKTYIGMLVIAMGFLCIAKYSYKFRWWKMYFIGALSAFNKALSGGGFGPVTSTGKIIGGLGGRVSVATTTYAEVPICLLGFLFYFLLSGMPDMLFTTILCTGAFFGGLIGPFICTKMDCALVRKIVGVLSIVSGIWIIANIFIW